MGSSLEKETQEAKSEIRNNSPHKMHQLFYERSRCWAWSWHWGICTVIQLGSPYLNNKLRMAFKKQQLSKLCSVKPTQLNEYSVFFWLVKNSKIILYCNLYLNLPTLQWTFSLVYLESRDTTNPEQKCVNLSFESNSWDSYFHSMAKVERNGYVGC